MRNQRGEWWVVGQMLLIAAIIFAPQRLGSLPAWPSGLVALRLPLGFGLAGLGALLGLSGARALGSSLSPLPKPRDDSRLVQHGIYHWLRHPIYSALILLGLGRAAIGASTPALILTLLLALWLDRKAAREEQWLLERYPEYTEYRRRVKRLIPFLY